MKSFDKIKEEKKVIITECAIDGICGHLYYPTHNKRLLFVASNGLGWNHVSVSLSNRTPTWEEMCYVKNIFFEEYEIAVQYHPDKDNYVNNHPHCLHLWEKQGSKFELPDKLLVGIKR